MTRETTLLQCDLRKCACYVLYIYVYINVHRISCTEISIYILCDVNPQRSHVILRVQDGSGSIKILMTCRSSIRNGTAELG